MCSVGSRQDDTSYLDLPSSASDEQGVHTRVQRSLMVGERVINDETFPEYLYNSPEF